jgi:hypothetical protein
MKKSIKYQLRTLTEEQYKEAPEEVRKIYLHVQKNVPMDEKEKYSILKAYPTYFTPKVVRTFGQNIQRMYGQKKVTPLKPSTNE